MSLGVLAMMAAPVLAGGYSLETSYASAFGPDAYGFVHLQASGGPAVEVGVLGVGGTQPAWLGTAARTVSLGPRAHFRGELALGMLREEGPSGGFEGTTWLHLGPVTATASAGAIGGLGWRGGAGVDAPLNDTWTLMPRLTLETWAGDRDPALRAQLGVRRERRGWSVTLAASAGGRDVLHMGPGGTVMIGRTR